MKECSNHPGYTIDVFGNVFSHRRKIGKGKEGGRGSKIIIDMNYCRLLRPSIGRAGYPQVYLSPDDRPYHVHRLVAETFILNPDKKPCVNHLDFNILNPHVDNLEWVTYSENNKHSVRHGRMAGDKSNLRKLSSIDILEIRRLAETNMKRKDIAKKFGIIPDYVRMIQRRMTWAYI